MAYNIVPAVAIAGDCTQTTDEAGKQRRGCSDGLGRLIEVDETGDSFAGSQAAGSFAVSGTLQSGTRATGSVTITGSEQSITTNTPYCAVWDNNGDCVDWETNSSTIYDLGTVSVTVNGHSDSSSYGPTDTTSTIASRLAAAINADSGAAATASSSGATVSLTAKAPGPGGNYSLASTSTWDTTDFSSPSFGGTKSGSALTGGNSGSPYDTGTITVTLGAFSTNVSYTQSGNSTAAQVASALATALSASSSPVTATASGATVSLTYKTIGPAGNVSVSCSSSTSQGTYFIGPSFTCPATLSLAGGYNSEAPSLDHSFYATMYQYDALGNMLRVDQKGSAPTDSTKWRTRLFTYNSLSQLLTAYNPESGTISYSYDADGNLQQKTSPAANQTGSATTTISFCYDELHRVKGKAYTAQACPLSSPVVTYTYDVGTNAKGYLTSLTDQAGSATYSYDVLGRLSSEQRTIAGVSKTLSYDYNVDGSVKAVHYPSGSVVTYTPDSAGRILSAVDSGSGINYVTGATYGPDSAITGFINGNAGSFAGISNTFSYNKRLQPINMAASAPGQTVFSIGYDFHVGNGTSGSDNGNVWGITNYRDNSRNQSFTYDSLNRLTSAQNAGTNCATTTVNGKTEYWGNSYGYDAWGNLLAKTVTKCGAENLSLTALANNQLSGYTHDAAGNMTHDGTSGLNYSYDQENRITGAGGYTYIYDGDGKRVEKANGSTGTLYWYMTPGIVAESDLAGTIKSEYVFFDGERVARRDLTAPTGVFYYFSDHLKTASVITDSAGNIKSESDYYPWGGELQFTNNDSNHYKFTGKERDPESGLDYFGARYYSNGLGRFISADWSTIPTPVPYADFSDPQSLNLYTYVRNIPTSKADLDGHDGPSWSDVGDFIVGAGNAYGSDFFLGAGRMEGNSLSYKLGQVVGDGVSIIHSMVEVELGTGGAIVGIPLIPAGGAGVAIDAVSVAVVAHGTTRGLVSVAHLAKAVVSAFASNKKQSTTPAEPNTQGSQKKGTGAAAQTGGKSGPGKNGLPGDAVKLKGNQGYRDKAGNIWKKDMLHKDHWDVSDSKGNKIREVDFNGKQIWPDGAKNKNK